MLNFPPIQYLFDHMLTILLLLFYYLKQKKTTKKQKHLKRHELCSRVVLCCLVYIPFKSKRITIKKGFWQNDRKKVVKFSCFLFIFVVFTRCLQSKLSLSLLLSAADCITQWLDGCGYVLFAFPFLWKCFLILLLFFHS